ncbi:MAG: hypothetical protein LBT46_00545 [Planctomycetaceae bacterium]|jgi:hypothetical protein|nr:hypothetical protein [Planctomycetaceae bacterium]
MIRIFRFTFPIIFAAIIFAAAPLLSGGETETLRYRRWLAPLEQIENWPFPPGLNVPIDRQLFEQYIEQSVTETLLSESSPAVFSKTVLKAEFDGKYSIAGTGMLELPQQRKNPESLPLEPLNIPVLGARWNDGTQASFVCVPEGMLRLVVPNQNVKRLDFRWSLQNHTPAESLPVFNIAVPLSLQSELQFDMPDTVIPASSSGIFISETENNSYRKSCRILLGQETKTTVTFQSLAEKSVTEKMPYRQTVSYRITEQGLDVTARFLFEKINVRINELFAEVEIPLRITDVRCGERSIAWQKLPLLSAQTVRMDLSGVSAEQLRDLTVLATAPVRENTDWKLPGIQIKSSNVFWLETRCGVNVFAPLRTSDIFVTNGVQVTPRTVVDDIQRELFTFQYFEPDASVTLNTRYHKAQMECQSATQIVWRTGVIMANTVLECQQEQGSRFALEFPLGENWMIDSVKSSERNETDNVESWQIWNDPQKNVPQKLLIQLKRPLEAKKTLMLQLKGRYLKNTQQKFQLETLLPLKLPLLKSSPHFIGIQFDDMPFRLRSAAAKATIAHHLTQGLTGSIFILDSQTQTSELALVRAEPDYTAEIAENILLAENGIAVTFLFRCLPVNSSADRIYVHFSAKNPAGENWLWTSSQSNLLPLRAKKLSEKELPELLPVFKTEVRLEDLLQGETWEIRLPALQTEPFDLQAAATLPLEESLTVPLAALPAAVSQKAEMTVSSPHRFDYRIVNSRLRSVPSAAESWNRYSDIQAAFRYDPAEELHRPGQTSLSLQKLLPNETVNRAWIWSLRLNSRYEPEGNIKHNVLMCIENRGRENITVTLPNGISVTDISSVLCSGTPADWRAGGGTNGPETSGNKESKSKESDEAALRRSLTIPLPAGKRFVTITVEYSHRDVPLVQQRKVRPRSITADIPVLSGTWTAWFPPDYDVYLNRTSVSPAKPAHFYGLSRCLAYWGSSKGFNPGSIEDWQQFFSQQRQEEAAAIADKFFAEMDESLKKNQITSWGNFLNNDQISASVLFRSGESVSVKLLIDKQAFRFIGITPAAPINTLIAVPGRSFTEELFDRSGLVLLVSSRLRADKVKEYTLGITSPLRLPLYRQIQSEHAGHCVRSAAPQIFEQPDNRKEKGQSGTNLSGVPLWDTPAHWVSETALSASPWLAAPPFTSSLNADWQAVELPEEEEQLLRIVRRETMTALQWLAFLATVLITSRKALSSPVLILLLLFVTEMIARTVIECYVMIPAGVFLGLCVSLGFTLIYSRRNIKIGMPLPLHTIKPYESTELDEQFVPTAILDRQTLTTGIIIFVTLLFCRSTAAEETLKLSGFASQPSLPQALVQKEAYRVFYPTDSDKQIAGSEVWLPYEFLKILSQQQKSAADTVQEHWSIVSAEYQGSLIRNPATESLESKGGFTAEFTVILDGGRAEITLGKLPVQTAAWDGKTAAVSQRLNSKKETVAVLLIENEVPGKHLLNVRMRETAVKSLPQGSGITFPIPKIPNSTLRLSLPDAVTDIHLADSCGSVTRTTLDRNILSADIGPADNISVIWDNGTETAAVQRTSVEEYLWLFAKAEQTELKALFRFHFADNQTSQVSIKADPRWLRSGQFRCDSVSITGQDTGDVTQITFRSPPDGAVTLRADFVPKNFSGIGNVLMPQFQVLQAKTAKKMLAVSAENNLELTLPPLGQSSSFLSDWYGEGLLLDKILDTRSWNTAPAAQYNVTPILQDWVLGIQAKKILPDVRIKEDVLFDVKKSVFVTAGEFETTADIFQLPFIFDKAAAIDSVEVRDSQNGLLESRYAAENMLTGNTSTGGTESGAADKTGRGKIFFRKAAKGKFSVTVTGSFDAGSQKLEPIPSLIFTDCNVKGQTLNLFRRISTLTEIHSGQSVWMKSNTVPSLPDAFVSRSAAPLDAITLPILPLGQYDAGTADGRSVFALPQMPQVLTKVNLPNLQGETRLTLHQENGGWAIEYAVTGKITGGELNEFRLIWDEHCQGVQSVQCVSQPCDWSLKQTGGHSVLVLSPKTPLTGHVQIHIKAALLQEADEVSVPVIFPETASAALQMFVQIPQKAGEETLPWKLQYLDVAKENDTKESGRYKNTHLLYRITDKEYRAKIKRTNYAPVITLLDTGFLLRPDGTLFGLAAADIKVWGQDSCSVQLPADCEVIQMTSNGIILGGTQLGNNRWQLDFWDSDYPQRLIILFRRNKRNNKSNNHNKNGKERRVEDVQAADNLLRFPLPVFEGIKVQETLWSLIKESGAPLEYDVQTLQKVRTQTNWDDNTVTDLGRRKFLTGNDIVQTQITVNLIRQHHLLRLLNSLPAAAPGRTEEVKRWYSHWSAEWDSVTEKINYQSALTAASAANEPNRKQTLLLDLQQESAQAASTAVFLETMTSKTRDALLLAKQQSVKEKIENVPGEGQTGTAVAVPMLNSLSYWQGRHGGETVYLFGVSSGAVEEIRLTAGKGGNVFPSAVSSVFWIVLCVSAAISILLYCNRIFVTELFLQFPHFWGTVAGLFLWSATPLSGAGMIIVILTLLSLFRPSWQRRKMPEKH